MNKKTKKPKKVAYTIIPRHKEQREDQSDLPKQASPLYIIMDNLVANYHTHLAEANILLAWKYGWKPDIDGHMPLGHIKKASESKVHGSDFIIFLNFDVFNNGATPQSTIEAVIDHQLSHAKAALEEDGEYKRDEDNKIVYRLAKHDFECFLDVVQRHGNYTEELKRLSQIVSK